MDLINKKIKDSYDSVNLPEKIKKQGLEFIIYSYDNSRTGTEEINVTKINRHKIRKPFIITAAIAVAAMLTISAGAAVAKLLHKESIDGYFGDGAARIIENNSNQILANGQNEYFNVTIDAIVSDGYYAYGIISAEGINEEGQNIVNNSNPISLIEIDNKNDDLNHKTAYSSSFGYNLPVQYNVKGTKSALFEIQLPKVVEPTELIVRPTIGSDIILPIDLNKNISYSTFVNDDGEEFRLTPFTMSGKRELDTFNLVFTMKDGTKVNMDPSCYGSNSADDVNFHCHAVFDKLIDLDNCVSMTFEGKNFIKK